MTVLLIGADRREFAGLSPLLAGAKRLDWPVDWAESGELRGHRLVLVANGPGPRLAGSAVREAAARISPDVVISVGFCGALNPSLTVAEVFIPAAIEAAGRRYAVERPGAGGVLLSTDRVIASIQEKRDLFSRGADAVEMEAAGVVEAAAALGLTFYAIRTVTDLADEGFPIDFNRARLPDGHFSVARIVAGGLRHPRELLKLARRARLAARALGDFVADCGF